MVFVHLDSAASRFFKLEEKQKELDELLSLYKKEGLAAPASNVQEKGETIASKENAGQEGAAASLVGNPAQPTTSGLQKEPPAKEEPSAPQPALAARITPPSRPQQALSSSLPAQEAAVPSSVARRLFDWENFTVVKLLSWVGGFTLFLGVAFWIK